MFPSDSEIAANVQSIEAIPDSILPPGDARDYLISLARSGEDCYGYCSIAGHWNVWLRVNRYAACEWAIAYKGGVR